MAKKNFDDFLDTVEKPKRLTSEDAARMVAEIHQQQIEPVAPSPAAPKLVPAPKIATKKTTVPQPPVAAARRGRPPSKRNETERLYRLSVDLPGSLLLKLKGAAMADGTDMKTYVRDLLDSHLSERG